MAKRDFRGRTNSVTKQLNPHGQLHMKWGATPGDLFDAEDKLKTIKPMPALVESELQDFTNRYILTQARGKGAAVPGQEQIKTVSDKLVRYTAKKNLKAQLNSHELKQNDQFAKDFMQFMLAKHPKTQTYTKNGKQYKDPSYVRDKLQELGVDPNHGPFQGAGVREYIGSFIKKKSNFMQKYTMLRMGPNKAFPWELKHYFLWYKYIVRGVPYIEDVILAEFDQFFPDVSPREPKKMANVAWAEWYDEMLGDTPPPPTRADSKPGGDGPGPSGDKPDDDDKGGPSGSGAPPPDREEGTGGDEDMYYGEREGGAQPIWGDDNSRGPMHFASSVPTQRMDTGSLIMHLANYDLEKGLGKTLPEAVHQQMAMTYLTEQEKKEVLQHAKRGDTLGTVSHMLKGLRSARQRLKGQATERPTGAIDVDSVLGKQLEEIRPIIHALKGYIEQVGAAEKASALTYDTMKESQDRAVKFAVETGMNQAAEISGAQVLAAQMATRASPYVILGADTPDEVKKSMLDLQNQSKIATEKIQEGIAGAYDALLNQAWFRDYMNSRNDVLKNVSVSPAERKAAFQAQVKTFLFNDKNFDSAYDAATEYYKTFNTTITHVQDVLDKGRNKISSELQSEYKNVVKPNLKDQGKAGYSEQVENDVNALLADYKKGVKESLSLGTDAIPIVNEIMGMNDAMFALRLKQFETSEDQMAGAETVRNALVDKNGDFVHPDQQQRFAALMHTITTKTGITPVESKTHMLTFLARELQLKNQDLTTKLLSHYTHVKRSQDTLNSRSRALYKTVHKRPKYEPKSESPAKPKDRIAIKEETPRTADVISQGQKAAGIIASTSDTPMEKDFPKFEATPAAAAPTEPSAPETVAITPEQRIAKMVSHRSKDLATPESYTNITHAIEMAEKALETAADEGTRDELKEDIEFMKDRHNMLVPVTKEQFLAVFDPSTQAGLSNKLKAKLAAEKDRLQKTHGDNTDLWYYEFVSDVEVARTPTIKGKKSKIEARQQVLKGKHVRTPEQ